MMRCMYLCMQVIAMMAEAASKVVTAQLCAVVGMTQSLVRACSRRLDTSQASGARLVYAAT
jgi:hypothetical protein